MLRHLVDEPDAFAEVARTASNSVTSTAGEDRRRADRAKETAAACYDCLLSYSNQTDTGIDHKSIRDLWGFLGQSFCIPDRHPRAEHLRADEPGRFGAGEKMALFS